MWILINMCSIHRVSWETLIILHHNFSCGIQRQRWKMLVNHHRTFKFSVRWMLKISRMRFVHDERERMRRTMFLLFIIRADELPLIVQDIVMTGYGLSCAFTWRDINMNEKPQKPQHIFVKSAFGWHIWQCTLRFRSSDILSFVTCVVLFYF